ncbi:MAG: hypothetical protein LBG44_01730 [Gemmatimonadota bacterium]|nr:hypothetical protein [Gemmatimonadota bacterium]
MISKRCGFGATALTVLSLAATPAFAQLCTGVPLNVHQSSLSLRADMPDGGNIFTVRGANKLAEVATLGASYSLMSPDGGDSTHSIGVDGAFELPLNLPVGVCAVAGIQTNLNKGDGPRTIQVPIGASLSYDVDLGNGLAVVPFVVPQLLWARQGSFDYTVGNEVVTADSASDSTFLLAGGANLIVNNLAFGLRLERIMETGAKTQFGVLAGINF